MNYSCLWWLKMQRQTVSATFLPRALLQAYYLVTLHASRPFLRRRMKHALLRAHFIKGVPLYMTSEWRALVEGRSYLQSKVRADVTHQTKWIVLNSWMSFMGDPSNKISRRHAKLPIVSAQRRRHPISLFPSIWTKSSATFPASAKTETHLNDNGRLREHWVSLHTWRPELVGSRRGKYMQSPRVLKLWNKTTRIFGRRHMCIYVAPK